jgi:hypothetical protein
MACGCPVVSSAAASLPEVCGDAALLVDLHETPAAPLVDALLLKPDPALASFRSHTGLEKWRLADLMPLLNASRPVSTPASP